MMRLAAVALLGAALAAPPAHAATSTYGSDLSLSATISDSNPQDWMAWPAATTPPSAGGYVVPEQGEVAAVAFRGQIDAALGVPPGFVARVVVLRPQPDGRLLVTVASTDIAPRLVNAGAGAVTAVDLQQFPERMCALPGDVVALATSGGYDAQRYPAGVPVQLFAGAPASATGLYKVPPGGDSISGGDLVTPSRRAGVELLMRITVGTGADARPTCRGAATPGPAPAPTVTPASSPVTLPATASARVRRKRVRLPVRCEGPTSCAGRLVVSRKGGRWGSAPFALAADERRRVVVKLRRSARRAVRRARHGLTVKLVATTAAGQRVTGLTVLRR